jgi:Arc/MetJ family transcription regulator
MRKHTTLNLDVDLLRAAQEVLGTSQTTETVHRALMEVVNRRKREQLAAYDFPDLTPEFVDEMRRDRGFASAERLQPT